MRRLEAGISALCLAWTAVLCLLAVPSFAGARDEARWWSDRWSARRTILLKPDRAEPVGVVSFHHAGLASADGADVRIVAGGLPVRSRAIQTGPGDFIRIAFDMRQGEQHYVYYGCKDASFPKTQWTPDNALLLETRPFNGGDPKNLPAMRQIIKRSGPPFGANLVHQVFHGHNPFGRQTNYVSIYRGRITAPADGKYQFCTSSDDASFLIVRGRLAVQWPGWHGAVGNTRHKKTVRLSAGKHEFEYLHVNGGAFGIAVAAWNTPRNEKIVPIPAPVFGSFARGKVGEFRIRGQEVAADFQPEFVGEASAGERYAFRVRFRDMTWPTSLPDAGVLWQFGDGTEGRGTVVEHVYLESRVHSVRMELSIRGKKYSVTQRVSVDRDWKNVLRASAGDVREYARIINRYNLGKMASEALKTANAFFERAGMEGAKTRLAREVAARPGAFDDGFYCDEVIFLVHSMREEKASRRKALQLLERARKGVKDKRSRARLLRESGDILFYYQDDYEAALRAYDDVVSRFADVLEDNIVRVTKIKIGDVYRKMGKYVEAAERYQDAERFKLYTWSEDKMPVRKGAMYQTVEDLLRRAGRMKKSRAARRERLGLLDEAKKMLEILEWEFPMEKLVGYSTILRCRIAIAQGNYKEATKQSDDFVRVAPHSPYAPEALYMAAYSCEQWKHIEDAVERYERIVKDYRESDRHMDATARLKELKRGR